MKEKEEKEDETFLPHFDCQVFLLLLPLRPFLRQLKLFACLCVCVCVLKLVRAIEAVKINCLALLFLCF